MVIYILLALTALSWFVTSFTLLWLFLVQRRLFDEYTEIIERMGTTMSRMTEKLEKLVERILNNEQKYSC